MVKRSPIKRTPMKRGSKPKMTPIRASAKGQPCQVRVPGVCNGDPSTTILAHLNGGGMGYKHPDWMGAWACSACHALIDREYVQHGITRDERDLIHYRAILKTQESLVEMGLIKVAA